MRNVPPQVASRARPLLEIRGLTWARLVSKYYEYFMAEAEKVSLEELEKEVTCAVFKEHDTEPKVLPCLHNYCKKCILNLTLKTGIEKPLSCPECHKKIILSEGGVDELKTAFFINRLNNYRGIWADISCYTYREIVEMNNTDVTVRF